MELRPWTLPNFLTFARLAALPFLVMAILDGRAWAALVIFLAAAVTDIVDGYLARRFAMGSPLGAWLDPIADKLFLVSTFVVFALPGTPTSVRIPMWLLVLTIFRDLYILVTCLVLFLALGIRSFPPSILGKLTTFLEISTVTAILLVERASAPARRRDGLHVARRGLRDRVRPPLHVEGPDRASARPAPAGFRARRVSAPRSLLPAPGAAPPALRLLTRPGCHLCDEMKARVVPLVARLGGALSEVDVDSDPALSARFGLEIPVLLDAEGPRRRQAPRRRRADREASRGLSAQNAGTMRLPAAALLAVFALAAPLAAERLPVQRHGVSEGLAEETVTALLKDSRGYLWVGSLNGLSPVRRRAFPRLRRRGRPAEAAHLRARGGRRTAPSGSRRRAVSRDSARRIRPRAPCSSRRGRRAESPSSIVWTDRKGAIWYGTGGEIFEGLPGGRPRAPRASPPRRPERGRPRPPVGRPTGSILAGTSKGLFRVAPGGKPERLALSKEVGRTTCAVVSSTARGGSGSRPPAASSSARGAGKSRRRRSARARSSRTGDSSSRSGRGVAGPRRDSRSGTLGLAADPRAPGRARRAHDDGGPRRRGRVRLELFGKRNGLGDGILGELLEDGEGNLWIGTQSTGLLRVRPTGFTSFGEEDGLLDVQVADVFRAATGTLSTSRRAATRLSRAGRARASGRSDGRAPPRRSSDASSGAAPSCATAPAPGGSPRPAVSLGCPRSPSGKRSHEPRRARSGRPKASRERSPRSSRPQTGRSGRASTTPPSRFSGSTRPPAALPP